MKTTRHSFFHSLNFSSLFSHLPLSSLFLTFLTFLTFLSANAQVPSYVPTNGLVGYWPFNGNANDESGNGNNGTVNGATLAADRFGIADKTYGFNGQTDFIETPISSQSVSSQTFSVWFKTQVGGTIISGSSFPNQVVPNFVLKVLPTSVYGGPVGQMGFHFDNPDTQIGIFDNQIHTDNNWHLVVAVFDGAGFNSINSTEFKLYIDGQFQNSSIQVNTGSGNLPVSNNSHVLFGKHAYWSNGIPVNPESIFQGLLDDIGIWNRELNADEILALYNGCNVAPLAVSGNVTPTQFTQETYTYPNTAGSTYTWTVTNGVIVSGQGTNSIDVMWANTGIGQISVVETNASNCTGDVVTYDVVVIPTNVEELSNAMILYPNPATTELNLQITSDLIGTDFFVFDALGKQILKQQILSTNTIINSSSFAAGNYVVKVGEGVKKFEVEK